MAKRAHRGGRSRYRHWATKLTFDDLTGKIEASGNHGLTHNEGSMGFRRYKGPVNTLEQASLADFPVRITCQKCGHFKQMHAFEALQKLSKKKPDGDVQLFVPVKGVFKCRCGHATVKITAPMKRAYE